MFTGSYVALVTPMFDNGDIDYQSLEKLVQFHIEQGTHGIVSVGTTGESATLPFDEHVKVVKETVAMASGAIPIIAGSGANSTAEAIFLTEQIGRLGVDGFLSVVPYYNKPQQKGMIAHFNAVADASDLPVILYNVPGRTVADMLPETVAELANHKSIVGLKDATGDIGRLKATQPLVPSDFVILSGDDESSSEFLCEGGHGVISVTANIVPNAIAKMCEASLAGDFAQCRAINDTIKKLHSTLFIEPNPVMPKWALYKMAKMESAAMRLPMVLPELTSQKEIEELLQEYALISG
ncbi:4-hydroxy-tetrahydrodipicolinate synthase [Alteromonas sp. KUL49]|uniref:4-hydroxy-tetrahydrodipicolinate synthase n=1 Tax=Alteromonas sp. KUL49 TaxID=2480798 RepID=UPI00102F21A3|nr:4-hydroxy-tetrahydrodipicolinate synthase [Alteromonas sp. KUL49]TAP40731.1 4-hydroxy-tetrahydrodipicolinate synthase [Alteromonas sp. KUL49]GEA10899.1 4-hydroxy-tetrahydrodipicolinate synthase [Alteromonas sp. KUL49]